MSGKDRLFERIAAARRWLAIRAPHQLAPVAFGALHVAGGLLAVVTLREAWRYRLVLQILTDRPVLLGIVRLPWTLILLALGLTVVAASVEVGHVVRRRRRREPEPDGAVRLRAVLYVALAYVAFSALVLSTPESFKGPFRVRFPIVAQIGAALAYGVYALWSLLLPRLQRAVPPRVRRGLDVAGMNLVLALVLAEGGLRILAAVWASPLLVTEDSTSRIRRNAGRRQPGSLQFGFPLNMGAHYDTDFAPPSPTRGRVAVSIGDSFSYGVVPHAYHFTTVAERALPGVEFYNMGFPGIGPTDYFFLLLEEALPLEPDVVVVNLFVGNDIVDGPSLAGPRRWYDADRYLLAILWNRVRILRRAHRIDVDTAAGQSRQDVAALETQYPWLTDPLREPPGMSAEVFGQLELRNALDVCRPEVGIPDGFFRALDDMKIIADGIPLAFVLIPDEFQLEDDLWTEVTTRAGRPLDRDRPQRLVGEWLAARGYPVLDLLPLLRGVGPLPDGRRHLYHRQDTHFNARGNEFAGRAVARFVDSVLTAGPSARLAVADTVYADVALPFRLDIGDDAARAWMRAGWQDDEASGAETFAWSDGGASELAIPLPGDRDVRITLTVLPFAYPGSPPQRVTIVANGIEVGQVALRAGMERYSTVLPADALRRPLDILSFRYAWARSPRDVLRGSVDRRTLAVAWYAVEFEPDGD